MDPSLVVEKLLELAEDVSFADKQLSPTFPINQVPSRTGPASMSGFASVHRRASSTGLVWTLSSFISTSSASSIFGSVSGREGTPRKPLAFPSPRVPEAAAQPEESLGFDKPSFVYDHSEVEGSIKI